MNLDIEEMEPNQFIIGKEDYNLLEALKVFLQYQHIKVPNGDNYRLELASNGGYHYAVTDERIISYANARIRELSAYRKNLSEELQQTQSIIEQLPEEKK
ncbi:hypothetical protein KKP3664_000004 [Citrobacter phage KKP_3664]|nr:hypothetical protein KKP3664_000004 [Citrobacter phage KKP_3664]